MKDAWFEYVALEIADAMNDEERLLAITEAILEMERLDLIPHTTCSELLHRIQRINESKWEDKA